MIPPHQKLRHALFAALAVVLLAACGAMTPRDQGILVEGTEGADFGLWYGYASTRFADPPASADPAVKGYSDVLPPDVATTGWGMGFGYSFWAIHAGFGEGSTSIKKDADLDGDTVTETTVDSVTRTNYWSTVLLQFTRWFQLGVGREGGLMEFKRTGVTPATDKLWYGTTFYTFGFSAGFDPLQGDSSLYFSIQSRVPATNKGFDGSTVEFRAGFFF